MLRGGCLAVSGLTIPEARRRPWSSACNPGLADHVAILAKTVKSCLTSCWFVATPANRSASS